MKIMGQKVFIIILCMAFWMKSNNVLAQESPAEPNANDQTTTSGESGASDSSRLIRPKYTDDLNKESSSFVADPDSLDPLPLKKESLKEDEEPVLEDIKAILKSKNNPVKSKTAVQSKSKNEQRVQKTKKNKTRVKIIQPKSELNQSENRTDDEPDYTQEQKLHDYYLRFNSSPTSEEVWGKLTSQVQGKNINVYVVQKGDTLASISYTLFGDAKFWPKIWSINRLGITNPHQIWPGEKIYIMSGGQDSPPVLAVGDHSQLGQIKIGELGKYDRQNTEFSSNQDVLDSVTDRIVPFQKIPNSFPQFVNKGYMSSQKPEVTIVDFETFELPDRPIQNPFVFSSKEIKSEIVIKETEIEKLLCRDNHYVPPAVKVNDDEKIVAGDYLMLIREDIRFAQIKNTFVYRQNGVVKVNSDGSLRISKCAENSTSDIIFVTSAKLKDSIFPPAESMTSAVKPMQIADGFNVNSQSYFDRHQYFVFLLPQENQPNEGAQLGVYSDSAGRVVGQVRFLKKEGNLGLGYLLKSDDLIQVGDKLVTE